MKRVFVIGEIGVNHNGNIDVAKRLILGAKQAGADAVKFQKRTIDKVYSQSDLDKPRESPWGTTTRQQKMGLEFTKDQYAEIDEYCKQLNLSWFASPWDVASVDFLEEFKVPYYKIPSALLVHYDLLKRVAETGKRTFIATGMSSIDEIERALGVFNDRDCPYELMHCNSSYPMNDSEANLMCIKELKRRFNCNVGYSCHSTGIIPAVVAVSLGATSIEKHITLDRAMYGSDQAASLELHGFAKMIEYIRFTELLFGDGVKRVYTSEESIKAKLRRTNDF